MFDRLKNWDSKTVLAALFLAGYFALILFLPSMISGLDENARGVVDKLVDPLGPVIGIIAFAIWRNSQRDNIEAEANAGVARENAETVKLLVHKAPPPTLPAEDAVPASAPAPAPRPAGDPWEDRP